VKVCLQLADPLLLSNLQSQVSVQKLLTVARMKKKNFLGNWNF